MRLVRFSARIHECSDCFGYAGRVSSRVSSISSTYAKTWNRRGHVIAPLRARFKFVINEWDSSCNYISQSNTFGSVYLKKKTTSSKCHLGVDAISAQDFAGSIISTPSSPQSSDWAHLQWYIRDPPTISQRPSQRPSQGTLEGAEQKIPEGNGR